MLGSLHGLRAGALPATSSTSDLPEHLAELEKKGYPYDIVQLRWNVGGDNGPPDATLSDVVKNWNAKHAYPKLVIATTREMFREFEKRYGDKIPVVRGDFTPYWEDGAGSSARETALNRTAAERLVQAETLWCHVRPATVSRRTFTDAWRNVILYDEHTWGAYNSITEPDLPFVKDQWKIKQAFALDADAQSQSCLTGRAGQTRHGTEAGDRRGRVQHVVLAADRSGRARQGSCSAAGDVVADSRRQGGSLAAALDRRTRLPGQGRARPGRQAIHDRRRQVPPTDWQGESGRSDAQHAGRLASSSIRPPGDIASLRGAAIDAELCDARSGIGLNRYYYVLGNA